MIHEYVCRASASERKRMVRNARNLIALYRDRGDGYAAGLFHDPAWIILLNLYVANHVGKSLSILDVVDISLAPPTTAVRHVQNLQSSGLIEQCRTDDGDNTAELKLTQEGYDYICHLLGRMT